MGTVGRTEPGDGATDFRTLGSLGISAANRELAFQLYEARGREDGHDVEDWLQAEAALRRDTLLPKASIAAAVYEDLATKGPVLDPPSWGGRQNSVLR